MFARIKFFCANLSGRISVCKKQINSTAGEPRRGERLPARRSPSAQSGVIVRQVAATGDRRPQSFLGRLSMRRIVPEQLL